MAAAQGYSGHLMSFCSSGTSSSFNPKKRWISKCNLQPLFAYVKPCSQLNKSNRKGKDFQKSVVVLHGTASSHSHRPYNRLGRLLSFCAARNWRTAPCHLRHRAQCLGPAGPTCWAIFKFAKRYRVVQLFTQDAQEDISTFKRSSAMARQIYVHGTLMTLLFARTLQRLRVSKHLFASLDAIRVRSCLVHAIQRKPAFPILSPRPSFFNLKAACINFAPGYPAHRMASACWSLVAC